MKEKEVGIGIVVIPESRICGIRVGMAVGSSKENHLFGFVTELNRHSARTEHQGRQTKY